MPNKGLNIIMEESLYDGFPAQVDALVEKGHTVRKLLTHEYHLILGPKCGNLTSEDLKISTKLLDVAVKRAMGEVFPKEKKAPKATKKAVKDGVEDPKEIARLAEAGGVEEITGGPAPVKKRKPRAKKQAGGGEAGKGDQPAVDPAPEPAADPAGGGK